MLREGPIKALPMEASPLFSTLISGALTRHADVMLTPAAANLDDMRRRLIQHHPHVILLDLGLPDALIRAMLKNLREYYPAPVIICGGGKKNDAQYALELIGLGALDVVIKPRGLGPGPIKLLGDALIAKIREAVDEARPAPVASAPPAPIAARAVSFSQLQPDRRIIVVGASTGGTEAVRMLLSRMPPDCPPIAVVQHMPPVFTASFADRLDALTPLSVGEAREGEILTPGRAVVARGDTHMTIKRRGGVWRVGYTDQIPVNRHCPSVDVLFDSAVKQAGSAAVGVLLTGMGADGARGLLRLRQAGALTAAQDSASCVVYGMPKVAASLGAAELIGRPENLPRLIARALATRDRAAAAVRLSH